MTGFDNPERMCLLRGTDGNLNKMEVKLSFQMVTEEHLKVIAQKVSNFAAHSADKYYLGGHDVRLSSCNIHYIAEKLKINLQVIWRSIFNARLPLRYDAKPDLVSQLNANKTEETCCGLE